MYYIGENCSVQVIISMCFLLQHCVPVFFGTDLDASVLF